MAHLRDSTPSEGVVQRNLKFAHVVLRSRLVKLSPPPLPLPLAREHTFPKRSLSQHTHFMTRPLAPLSGMSKVPFHSGLRVFGRVSVWKR